MIQRLKFGVMAMFDLVNISNSLDLDLHFSILRKKKNGLGVNRQEKCSPASFFFSYSFYMLSTVGRGK